jgi:hypothetical protein
LALQNDKSVLIAKCFNKNFMKKVNLVLVICLFLVGQSFAQTEYGIRAGLNYTTMFGKLVDSALIFVDGGKKAERRFMPAYHVGVYMRMPVSEQMYFQPELMISKKGFKNKITDVTRVGNPAGSEELTVNYFNEFFYGEINLLLGGRMNDNWRVHFGPQIGYLFEARRRVENEVKDFNTIDAFRLSANVIRQTLIDDFVKSGLTQEEAVAKYEATIASYSGQFLYKKRRPAVGLMAGIGYEFDFGLSINLNADFMLINPYKLVASDNVKNFFGGPLKPDSETIFRNLNFQLSVGYTIAPHTWYRYTHRGGRYQGRRW